MWNFARIASLCFLLSACADTPSDPAHKPTIILRGVDSGRRQVIDHYYSVEPEAAKKMLGLDRSSAGVDATGGSDGCTFCGSITLKAQGLEIQNARVRMVQTISPGCHFTGPNMFGKPASYDCAGAYPLHIGMNVLTRLHLYFANGEKKLYFTDAALNAPGAGSETATSAN